MFLANAGRDKHIQYQCSCILAYTGHYKLLQEHYQFSMIGAYACHHKIDKVSMFQILDNTALRSTLHVIIQM